MKRILSCILVMVLLVSLAGCGGSKCTSIVLSADEVSLSQPGQTKGLSVTKNPADAADKVSFKSSNPSVAVVDEYGLITAVGAGNATITVTCGDAVAFCEVTVGSGGANNPGNNGQQGGNQTDGPSKDPTQPTTTPSEPVTVDCPDCDNGICNNCGGNSRCMECDGSGFIASTGSSGDCKLCGSWEGDCAICHGTGFAPNCEECTNPGWCENCGGDGLHGNRNNVECYLCDGTGLCFNCHKFSDFQLSIAAIAEDECRACGGSGYCAVCSGIRPCENCNSGSICNKCTNGKCNTCSGEGALKQGNNGDGPGGYDNEYECYTCKDSGACPYCWGCGSCGNEECINGRVTCSDCYGTGECGFCYGRGTKGNVDCPQCNDGVCGSCKGKEKWDCPACKGSGNCTYCEYGFCPACGG